jgi:glycosyltransferase involved in cell wall biosynthesis
MKCGCPVLTSASSSLPEVGGDAALYAEPNDIDDLKEKLRQIIEDEELRKTLREKGFVQASKFDWKKSC